MKLNFERKEVKQWIKKLDNGGSSAVISAFKDWLILADEVERQAKLIERLVEDGERLANIILRLKKCMGGDGDYSFCAKNGDKLGMDDALIIGQLCEDGDNTLDQHTALMQEVG